MTADAAYLVDGRPAPRETFYALACDPRRSVVVEACAGAGKTWMLVSRILRALLEGAEPHAILAITFTRKAAGEMRERLADWLREFAAPECDDTARARALVERGLSAAEAARLAPRLAGLRAGLLASGRPVEIRTFHAWFAQLLRAAPIEALAELGLPADFELVEDTAPHRPAVFRRFHAALIADPALRADHAALIATRGRSQVRKWLETTWDRHVEIELADRAGVLEGSVPPPMTDPPGEHPAAFLMDATWQAELATLAEAFGPTKPAQDAAARIRSAVAQHDIDACFGFLRLALFTNARTRRLQIGRSAALERLWDELERIAPLVQQLHAHLDHIRMVRLARALLAEYAAYKRANGLADMPDLERSALALLGEAALAGWVQERLDVRVRHLLIDEFQDTSPLQWHTLQAWLAGYAGAGGGASGQRPPGVFIVGDPKQSIYRFRRADPRVFAAARRFVVEALGGHALACDHTRRNAPEVLAALNAVFEEAQAAGDYADFRPHTTERPAEPGAGVFRLPLSPRPPRAGKGGEAEPKPWRDTLLTPRRDPERALAEQEAERVAAAIDRLIAAARARPDDIFVLCRARKALGLVATALAARGIACGAVEDTALMDWPEARDLVALLDALVSPRHRLSLAQALRSPLFGASDADLLALADQAEHGDWWDALLRGRWDEAAGAPARPALQRARALLPGWRRAAAALPPHDLLDRIVFEGELRERVAAAVPPLRRAGALFAIDAVVGQALRLDGARYATPYGFVRALKRGLVKAAPPAAAGAVQLLTVHGAKGLEADVVFVVDADPEPRNSDTATLLVDWPAEAAAPRCCAFVYTESAVPLPLQALLEGERAANRREELNALYVAMSRARRRLVFSATPPTRTSDTTPWWRRVEPHAVSIDPDPADLPASEAILDAASAAPRLRLLGSGRRAGAPELRGAPEAPEAQGRVATGAPDAPTTAVAEAARRLGLAVHRVLEWAGGAGAQDGGAPLATLAEAAGREFGAPAAAVARIAEAILQSPACAPFFARDLGWAGNEVTVGAGGQLLRIDRLVRLDDAPGGPEWWVLDYKLQQSPAELMRYHEPMRRYRRAVEAAEPGARVRSAFITGAGALIEVV